MTRFYIVFYFFLFFSAMMVAQTKNNIILQKPTTKKTMKLIHAGLIEKKDNLYDGNPLFTNEVQFEYDNATLRSDSAIVDQQQNNFRAFSNVFFTATDTLQISSKSMDYDGNTRIVTAKGNVVLTTKDGTLLSEEVFYNRVNQTAYFTTGGTLVSKESTVSGTNGTFFVREKKTIFTDNVKVVGKDNSTILSDKAISYDSNNTIEFIGNVVMDNKDYKITTQKTIYHPKQNKMDFFTNTTIVDKANPTNTIQTNNGVFNTKNKETFLNSRSTVRYGTKYLTGDKLYFNQTTGFGRAKGNVIIDEPNYNRFIKGEYAEVYRKKDSAFVTKNAVAIKSFGKDSLYIHSDTLFAVTNKNKENVIRAYHKAKFYKSNLQGKADSLTFNDKKGLLTMHKKPIIWFGHSQLTGDTIYAHTQSNNNKIDSILVKGNPFILNKVDTINLSNRDFNQSKGNRLKATFNEQNEVDLITIKGNAQSLIYLDDEDKIKKTKKRIGINLSNCGIISASVKKKTMHLLNCEIDADSKIYPESKIPNNARFFDGFNDLFNQRIKNSKELFKDD
jgi:lipopolysaccharide export system protein LptA